ncbi:MAG: alginate export family protein, partial [Nannocystaceae bacterium]|nr:alginate export family protein [Nannocystaceae bacterium]
MRPLHWVRGTIVAVLCLLPAILHAAVQAPEAATHADATEDRPVFTPLLRINLRGEARANAGNSPDPTTDSWRVVEGVRAGIKARYRELTVVAQFQDVRAWGQGGLISSNPFTGLHQGYIEVGGETNRSVSGFIRVGRQEIVYGSRRHFHSSPFNIAGRAFDGVRAQLNVGKASLDLSYMLAARPESFTVVGPDDTETSVRGRGDHLAYGDLGFDFHPAAELHAAVILQRLGARETDPTRDRSFIMPGARMTGDLSDELDYEVEGWLQRGSERDLDLRTWMAAATIRYTSTTTMHPGARLHYEIHSGSRCTGDPTAGEPCGGSEHRDFDQLDGARVPVWEST